MRPSKCAPIDPALSALDDQLFLQRVIRAAHQEPVLDHQPDFYTPQLPAEDLEILSDTPPTLQLRLRACYLTLHHLSIKVSRLALDASPATFHAAFVQLYRSKATGLFISTVLHIPRVRVTRRLILDFFARLSWLDQASINSDTAKRQLDLLLYETAPQSLQTSALGKGEFSELGDLLTPVPPSLRPWMLQFKLNGRLPLNQWLTTQPDMNLLYGLVTTQGGDPRLPLACLAAFIGNQLPPGEGLHDGPLAQSLEQQLARQSTQQHLTAIVEAAPPWNEGALLPQSFNPWSQENSLLLLQRLARATLAAEHEAWVPLALESARCAPGMQAFSFAATLAQKHPSLSPASCLRLGSLLFPGSAEQTPAPAELLAYDLAMDTPLPAFEAWCPLASADALFNCLGLALFCETKGGQQHLKLPAWQAWQAMVQSSHFSTLCQPLLQAMGWYGGAPGETPALRPTQALLARAVLAHCLGPCKGSLHSLERSFQGSWVSELSHLQLSERLREEVATRNANSSPATQDMLHYLLLRRIAPELLIANTPDWLPYGRALQSVALIHGARLQEALAPGSCCLSSFDDVVTLASSLSESQDPELQDLWSRTLALPALRYAAAHGAVGSLQGNDIQLASPGQIDAALRFFADAQLAVARDTALMGRETSSRRALAIEALAFAGVPASYWDCDIDAPATWSYLKSCGLEKSPDYGFTLFKTSKNKIPGPHLAPKADLPRPTPMSLLELVMMGQVNVHGKRTVPERYQREFELTANNWKAATANLIKRVCMEQGMALRNTLHTGTCEISRVDFETQNGHHGLFIRCQANDHRHDFDEHTASTERYFELIPSAGVLRSCKQEFNYLPKTLLNARLLSIPVTGTLHGKQVEQAEARRKEARLKPVQPLDSDAYLTGTPSRSSQATKTPLKGTLSPASTYLFSGTDAQDVFFQRFAETAAAHLLAPKIKTIKQQTLQITPWEETLAAQDNIRHEVAKLLLPFYGCISDLKEGDRSASTAVGCAFDVVGLLVPTGLFIRSAVRIARTAGALTLRSASEAMATALSRLGHQLAQEVPVVGAAQLLRGTLGFSMKHLLNLPTLVNAKWLKNRVKSASLYPRASMAPEHSRQAGTLKTVDGVQGRRVHNIGSAENPDVRMLDPIEHRPFGPPLIASTTASMLETTVLARLITPDMHTTRVLLQKTQDDLLHLPVADHCSVRLRMTSANHYDLDIDGHVYRLAPNDNERFISHLSVAPIPAQRRFMPRQPTCRVKRGLSQAGTCETALQLISTPTVIPIATGTRPTAGRVASLAFEHRQFHLQRHTVPGPASAPPSTLDTFVHDGKFCKWGHEVIPAKGNRPERVLAQKTVTELSVREHEMLALPDAPRYKTQIQGRMSAQRDFGMPAGISGNQAKLLNPHIPTVELQAITEQMADMRTLRGIRLKENGQDVIYLEVDTGKFYKGPPGANELTFTQVTSRSEIDEYLRHAEQYRFVAERPYSLLDRENIATLLFHVAVKQNEPGIAAWLALSPANKKYETYVQWCLKNNERNVMLYAAENVLSAEKAQSDWVKLTKTLIPDWKPMSQRQGLEQLHATGILGALLPAQGKENLWVPLTHDNIASPDMAKLISKQVGGANLAYAAMQTTSGKRYVYYALSGGKRTKGIRLKPFKQGENSHTVDEVTYIDAGALMKNRSPDPAFTSLPVVRDADRLTIRPFDRHLDSERLIATIVKESHASADLAAIDFFTLLDTCRSCGGVVLPQIALNYPQARVSVSYLLDYPT